MKQGPRKPVGYPAGVERLIEEFARLPGIGRRSAERLAFHVARSEHAPDLARAISDARANLRICVECHNLAEAERCTICADPGRDRSIVLVVEQPRDLAAIEQTGMFRGVYHILLGRLSPLEGLGPGELTIDALEGRLANGTTVREVILGLNPTLEGDGTALYLAERLRGLGVRVTRLARGLPTGAPLEFASKAVLADALHARRSMEEDREKEGR